MFKYCPYCGVKLSEVGFYDFTCPSCHKKHYFNSKPAVGVIPIHGDEILMAIRGVEPYKGYLDTIGGFLENGEEILDGAVREFEEETGMKINKKDLKFLSSCISEYYYDSGNYRVLNLNYIMEVSEKFMLEAKDDVAELVWIKIKDLKGDPRSTKFTNKVFEQLQVYLK
jgi:NAD+ diphosphatase